jgi:hypothetical protein
MKSMRMNEPPREGLGARTPVANSRIALDLRVLVFAAGERLSTDRKAVLSENAIDARATLRLFGSSVERSVVEDYDRVRARREPDVAARCAAWTWWLSLARTQRESPDHSDGG